MRTITIIILFIWSSTLYAQQPRLVLPIGHTYNIQNLVISADAKYAATSSSDKTVRLWDLKTGNILRVFSERIIDIHFVFFDSTGRRLFAGSKDGKVKAWDIYSGELILSVDGHHHEMAAMKFSYDGNYFLTAGVDSTAKVWDANTGKLLQTLNGHSSIVSDADFISNGNSIMTASWDMSVKIWDWRNGKLLRSWTDLTGFPRPAVASPDGRYSVFVIKGQGLYIWDVMTDKKNVIEYIPEEINTIKFIYGGQFVVTGASDGSVRIWDPATGKELNSFMNQNKEQVYTIAMSHNEKMLATGGDSCIYIWDLATGKLLKTLRGHIQKITGLEFYPSDKEIISASWDRTGRIWEIENGLSRIILKGHSSEYSSLFFDPSYKYLVISGGLDADDNILDPFTLQLKKLTGSANLTPTMISPSSNIFIVGNEIRSFPDGKLIDSFDIKDLNFLVPPIFTKDKKWLILSTADYEKRSFKIQILQNGSWKSFRTLTTLKESLWFMTVSPDSKYVFFSTMDDNVQCWDLINNRLVYTLSLNVQSESMIAFSPNNRFVAIGSADYSIRVYELASGKLLKTLNEHTGVPFLVNYSPNSRLLLASSTSSGLNTIVWQTDSWKKLFQAGDESGENYSVNNARFSNSGNLVLMSLSNGESQIRNAFTGKLLHTLRGHTDEVFELVPDQADQYAYSLSRDNTIRCWDITNGKSVSLIFIVDSIDHFVQIPSGYYYSTIAAAKLLHYVDEDLKVISFEQLDVQFNRPDKVLEAIGSKQPTLITSFRKAYEKRIKKLGVDTTLFINGYKVPEADFVNRNKLDYKQIQRTLVLHIKGSDSNNKLNRFNVWINETPLYGQRGISILTRNSENIDTTITIELSQGENRIETSVTNVNGTESYRMPLIVNYTSEKPEQELAYFIGIGISKFSDTKYNLQYSVKDIRDLAAKLKEKYGETISIDTLFNENVTLEKVISLKQKLLKTSVNDKVIVAYSGHGLLSKDFDYYLSTYSINFDKPEQNGLPYDDLENLLDSIPARKKLMLIDACHSGEVDKDDLIALNSISDSLVKGIKPVAYKKEGQLGLKNSFELMQNLFVNVGKSTGATIISAAAGTQFALERSDLNNGVFTYSILEAMQQNKTMKVGQLKKVVSERVEQLTNGLQKPTSRNETIAVDWDIF